MPVASCAITAHTILQNFIPLTYHTKLDRLVDNTNSRAGYLLRKLSIYLTIFYNIFSIIYVHWLITNWNTDIPNKAPRFIIYTITFSICIDAFVAYFATSRLKPIFIGVVNQCLKIRPRFTDNRSDKLGIYVVYASTLLLPALPTASFLLPFILDFLPYRIIWNSFCSNDAILNIRFIHVVRFMECTNYALVTAINAGVFVAFVLVVIVKFDVIYKVSETMLSGCFYNCVLTHRCVYILIQHFNEICYLLFGLVCSSVLMTGTCTCAMIKLGGKMPVILNLAFATVLAGNVILTVFLSYLAAIPNKAGKRFFGHWKHESKLLLSKLKQKYLNACPKNIGYHFGMIRCVDSQLGPNIMNRAVDATVNILLIF